jgi:hypothetical protein
MAVLVGVAVAALVTLGSIVPLGFGAALIAIAAWFALPGVVLARRLYGAWIPALLAGSAWGYALSSLMLLGLWAAGVRGFGLLAAPFPVLLAVLPARRLAGALSIPTFTRRDLVAVALVLLAVLAIVGRPFSRVGADLPDGRAYRAYFTADFVWAMAVTSEVSKGDVPPKNPFYVNDALHYYWLMHLVPAAEYRAAGGAIRLDQVLLVNALWAGLVFGGFLYFFVRHFVERPAAAAAACIGVLFCSSFEGLERIWTLDIPLNWTSIRDALRSTNIDSVGNWVYQGMKVDGLQRALFWQPQHLVGYQLGFSALLLIIEATDASRRAVLFLAGTFLGLSILFSSPAAAMLAAIVAVYETFRLAQSRRWKAFVPCALAGAAPMAGALALSAVLQYVDTRSPGNPLVTFGVNSLATHRVWLTIFLNFGPLVIVALAGLAAIVWRGTLVRFVPILLTIVVCAAFYVLVDVPDHGGVYVAWRASHLIFMALAALCGVALQEYWAAGGWVRPTIIGLAAIVALAALPTVLIDIYNAQDVDNRSMGPGFRWTVVLTPPELEGLEWVKHETPPSSRVQIEPFSRNRDAYYITAFGERRMSSGLPTGLIPLAKYEAASGKIKQLYLAQQGSEAHDQALALCVDYLMIGPPEREKYPQFQPLLDSSPHFFAPVFHNDALAIYAVSGSWEQPQCPH